MSLVLLNLYINFILLYSLHQVRKVCSFLLTKLKVLHSASSQYMFFKRLEFSNICLQEPTLFSNFEQNFKLTRFKAKMFIGPMARIGLILAIKNEHSFIQVPFEKVLFYSVAGYCCENEYQSIIQGLILVLTSIDLLQPSSRQTKLIFRSFASIAMEHSAWYSLP